MFNKLLRALLLVITLTCFKRSIAQSDSLIYFLDKNYETCSAAQAVFVGVAVKQNGLWKFDSYSNATEIKLMTGYYQDSLLLVSEGLFQYYSDLGKLINRGSFIHSKKTGIWEGWYDTGVKKDSILYADDKIVFKYEYREDGSILREAHWQGGSGEQKEYYPNGKLEVLQVMENDKVKSRTLYDEAGELKKEDLAKPPMFPGGQPAFQRWIDHLTFPAHIAQELNPGEDVKITFYLDEQGRQYNVTTSSSGIFTDFIRQRLSQSGRWQMNGFKKWGPITFVIHIN